MVLLIGLYSSVSHVFFSRSARSPWGLHWARGVGSLDILLRFGVDKYIQKKKRLSRPLMIDNKSSICVLNATRFANPWTTT